MNAILVVKQFTTDYGNVSPIQKILKIVARLFGTSEELKYFNGLIHHSDSVYNKNTVDFDNI